MPKCPENGIPEIIYDLPTYKFARIKKDGKLAITAY